MYTQSLSAVQQVDFALLLIFIFSGVMLLGLTLTTLWFIYRYHHKRNPVSSDIRGNTLIEVLWTVIPTCLVMGLFYFGWTGYQALRTVPDGAMVVQVSAKMFSWTFTYENGRHSNYLAVPTHKPVMLKMHTPDVIHSFYAPAFRIKMDIVPGMETYTWFKTDRPGDYDVYCAEYCGVGHSVMLTKIQAMPQEDFDTWLTSKEPLNKVDAGHKLMEDQGCFSCHEMGGKTVDAPALAGLFGKTITVMENGKEKQVVADEAYLKEAITDPGKVIPKGYDNTMPPYTDLTPDELDSMIEYMKSIGDDSPAGSHGAHNAPAAGGAQTAPSNNGTQTAPAGNGTQPAPGANGTSGAHTGHGGS